MAKKNNYANVMLWGVKVGVVAWSDESQVASFEYSPDFLELGLDLSPLYMSVESARRGTIFSFSELPFKTFRGLPGLLADSLPDKFGNAIIDQWLARQGRTPESFSPVERLCYTGARGMGALEFRPTLIKGNTRAVPVEVEEMVGLAQKVINKRFSLDANLINDPSGALADIVRVGTSAGGARAKAVVAINEETGHVMSGQADAPEGYEHWILKFDGVGDLELGGTEGYGRIEYAYYLMALECGIQIMKSALLEEGGRGHFRTRRFDRLGGKKVHAQTLCGLAHYDFNAAREYSYEQAFGVLRKLRLPYEDQEQFYRRMVFNVIARNQDDHTKNITFLMGGDGRWFLSPAYDVTYSYNPDGPWTAKHQMTINGKSDGFIHSDLIAAGRGIVNRPERIIEQTQEAVSRWPAFAKEAGVPPDATNQIQNVLRLHFN